MIKREDLGRYDFVMLIDKSGSMETRDCGKNRNISRWNYAKEQTKAFAEVCASFDDDGIDIILFSNRVKSYEGVTPEKVDQIFVENSAGGTTDTALAVQKAFDSYRDRGMKKPMIVVCVTDGIPDDQRELKDVIIGITKKIKSDDDFGILFLQVGYDRSATAFLDELDNNLSGAKFDVVSTVNAEDSADFSIVELLLKSINE